jgi:uncharacterized protein (TIGR00299 family) protein
MAVAALLDLGADREKLARALESLPVEGFDTQIRRVKKSSILCCDFCVNLEPGYENRDHDMEYLYGKTNPHGEEHPHTHAHRTLADIESILADCDMSDGALELAGRIFAILAQAEAQAHGVPVEEVHFHEVGAVDSIVDIVAFAVCMDSLSVDEVIIPSLTEGSGTVRTQHGLLPVPVPAVLNIAEKYGLSLRLSGARGEYVTPTGAAVCAAVRTADRLPEKFRVRRCGLGAGKREQELPGILRAMFIEPEPVAPDAAEAEETKESPVFPDGAAEDRIWKLETNIDDCSPEMLGYTLERLLEAGAKDAHYLPVYMKKNRPAYQLDVLCAEEDLPAMEEIIFAETSTIGIRRVRMPRTILKRHSALVETDYGKVRVKVVSAGEIRKVYPEYESVAQTAREKGVPFEMVYLGARDAYRE